MKPCSPRAPLSPARARNCALMNQFATPGLGSLMARRIAAGTGQLLVFLAGFILFVAFFLDEFRQYYGMMFSDDPIHLRYGLLWSGIATCAASWLWSLVTSISLIREANRNEREGRLAAG